MITKITDEQSQRLIAAGAGYTGVAGGNNTTTGDRIYGMEDGDYFIPAALADTPEAIEIKEKFQSDLTFFKTFFTHL